MDLTAQLLDALPDPVIGGDASGTIILWNRAAEAAYGYPAHEAAGRRAGTLMQTRFPAPLLEISEELADLGQWQGRLEHQTRDGSTVHVERRWIARRDPEGAFAGSVGVEREIVAAGQPAAGPATSVQTSTAFSASRLVWPEMAVMVSTIAPICSDLTASSSLDGFSIRG